MESLQRLTGALVVAALIYVVVRRWLSQTKPPPAKTPAVVAISASSVGPAKSRKKDSAKAKNKHHHHPHKRTTPQQQHGPDPWTECPGFLGYLKGASGVTHVALHPEGKFAAVLFGGDRQWRGVEILLPPSGGCESKSLRAGELLDDSVAKIAVGNDAKSVFVLEEAGGALRKFDVTSGGGRKGLMADCGVSARQAAPDGQKPLLCSGSDYLVLGASGSPDTELRVYAEADLRSVGSVVTKQIENVAIFACRGSGDFFGCCSWAPGVKLFHIERERKSGKAVSVRKAMELRTPRGTRAGALSPAGDRCLVVCKDGQSLLYNVGVEWEKSQDPKLLWDSGRADEFWEEVIDVSFCTDDMLCAATANCVRVFQVTRDSGLVANWACEGDVRQVAAGGGGLLSILGEDGKVRLITTQNGSTSR